MGHSGSTGLLVAEFCFTTVENSFLWFFNFLSFFLFCKNIKWKIKGLLFIYFYLPKKIKSGFFKEKENNVVEKIKK